ncbi:MAG: hypothetical protein MK008_11015 [Bdellovibrionales bacterium]|nr:hypothetical protein [Bdellovibrionales bacterium]
MKKLWLPITVLLIGFVVTQIYYSAKIIFSGMDELQTAAQKQTQTIARQQLQLELQQYKFQQYQVQLAKMLPQKIKTNESSYGQRKLASLVRSSESLLGLDAEAIMAKANKHYNKGECRAANKFYEKIKNEYSYSDRVVESYLLSIDCYTRMGLSSQAVTEIHNMTKLFPTSELTGYALIRFAEIQKSQSRIDSAKKTYLKVINSFPYPELAEQAREGLKGVLL